MHETRTLQRGGVSNTTGPSLWKLVQLINFLDLIAGLYSYKLQLKLKKSPSEGVMGQDHGLAEGAMDHGVAAVHLNLPF